MFKHFFQTTLRSLRKNKVYGFLNIMGLAIGIACAGLIFLWVEDEAGYDHGNVKRDQICLVKTNATVDGGVFTHSSTPGPLAAALESSVRGVEKTCRMTESQTRIMFRIGDRSLFASGKYAEASVFDLFTLPFVQGSAQTAFSQLHSIVLTETTAKRFFGNDKDVVGKTVSFDSKQDYVVGGVLKDLPENSTLQFEWLAPFEIFVQQSTPWIQRWGNFSITTYVELKPGVDAAEVNRTLLDPKYDFTTQKKETTVSTGHVFLFPMNQWRLYDQFDQGKQTGGGRIEYIRLFSTIAWIILLIACINFMNLATARSEKRSKEVGVRKVLGAGKKSLVRQFIGESIIMSAMAAFVAIVIMEFSLPAFNMLVQKHLSLGVTNPLHAGAILALALVCGLVAGSYPSFYLSSFNPVFVLKGMKVKAGSASFIRKGLVVLQFTVSIVLIIATVVIYQQVRHVKSRNLGFNKDNLVQLELQGNMLKNFSAIRQEFIATGNVENAALADHATLYDGDNTSAITWPGKDPGSVLIISQRLVSPEYMSTLGMHIKEGRDFDASDAKTILGSDGAPHVDSGGVYRVVITTSMERLLGKGSAIGKTLEYPGNFGTLHLQVEGVIQDYVYGDMYGQAAPVVFYCITDVARLMYVRLKPQADLEQSLSGMEKVLKKMNPGYPFEYRFVDDQFNEMFKNENLISRLASIFAVLTILISCLGLFGLAAYTAEQRTKEIGIRKVLGASVVGITGLLSGQFLRLIGLSMLIAFPTAWWIMHSWLQGYAYRIGIAAWVFALAGFLTIFISLITISFQSIRAALANPIDSLRTE